MTRKNTHCSFCGSRFLGAAFPQTCMGCGEITWLNPVPVVVALVPAGPYLFGVRRGIPPKLGEVALPGGFIDFGESWQTAASREFREELGLDVAPALFDLFDARSTPDGTLLLVFASTAHGFALEDLPPFVPNDEVTERVLLKEDDALAFPLHAIVARRYFYERQLAQGLLRLP